MSNWPGLLDAMTAIVRDTFGEPVSYVRARDGTQVEATAIFDPDHESVNLAQGSVPVSTVRPVLDIRRADLGFDPEQGDTVTVQARKYRVVDVEPTSAATFRLHLHRA